MIEIDDYYLQRRPEVCDLVVGRDLKVLDLGCASGALGAELKRRGRAAVVHGIEFDEAATVLARTQLEHVWHASLDTFDLEEIEPSSYDLVVAADVLEHLVDPWRVLAGAVKALRPGGSVVASFPNIRYVRVLLPLVVRGRFDYEASGVLDRTHLRFFTRRSIEQLATGAGLEVDLVTRAPASWRGPITSVVARCLGDFGTEQLLLLARRSTVV